MELIREIIILFGLGFLGWGLFHLLRLPSAPILGSIFLIGTLRALELPLPESPDFIAPGIQIILGLYIGAKVNRDTIKELRKLAKPAGIISGWALSVIFVFGPILSRFTWLDNYTAILSSSIGGLPEMTILAQAVGADMGVIVVMQSLRMIATIVLFPLLFSKWFGNKLQEDTTAAIKADHSNAKETVAGHPLKELPGVFFSLGVAALGGYIFLQVGVPAGGMVGAMFFVAAASVAGLGIKPLGPKLFSPMLVGVGVMVSGNFSRATVDMLISGSLVWPLILLTGLIFLSSFGIAWIIGRVTGWDPATSFLAAAPGGFTIMTVLAVKYNKNPFQVSMLHLVRLLAIKSVVPLVFMFLL